MRPPRNHHRQPRHNDSSWMRRALRNAHRGIGFTRPNPPVGAVLLSHQGRLIGEGHHHGAGHAHAEIEAMCNALKKRSADAEAENENLDIDAEDEHAAPAVPASADQIPDNAFEGCTLFVTLEPCATQGRTPPCTDAIIRAGIARVVIGCLDPNPENNGKGADALRDAGIRVDFSRDFQANCEELATPCAKRLTQGVPFLTLKLAMTLDGRIADRDGESKWITGEEAREHVLKLRRKSDAILIGGATAATDNPSLRLPKEHAKRRLMRIVIDGSARLPADAVLVTDDAAANTIIITADTTSPDTITAWQANGARVWQFPRLENGDMPLRAIMERLASEEELCNILCEGGGRLAAGLVREDLVDRYELFYAPDLLLEGPAGFQAPARQGFAFDQRLRLQLRGIRQFGPDILLRFQRIKDND